MPRPRRDGEKDGRMPTMRDVARVAGVHQTTVSLALRNHPSVAEKTRERIRAAAQRLGYRPDPLLDAFNEHRLAIHPTHSSSVIAYVIDEAVATSSQPGNFAEMRWFGVKRAAEERGLKVERFVVGKRHLSPERLNQILVTRNIVGVLVTVADLSITELGMDWPRFSAVRIESRHLRLRVDTVSADQRLAARLAVRNLRRLGYRRVGLTTAAEDEVRLGESMASGFLVEEAALAETDRVPECLFRHEDGPAKGDQVARWVREHGVEAVVSNWGNVQDALRAAGLRVPGEVAFASLDIPTVESALAGVMQNHELVGRTAVEHLAILLQTHQRGEIDAPAVTFVPGYWRDGPSAPPTALSSSPSGTESSVDPVALT